MKKSQRSDGIYVMHIADSLQDVVDFLSGKDYSEFVESKLLINAVVRSFEIAGEATKNLSPEFRLLHPEIDWTGMAGFRDVLIHQYFGIDLANVWDVFVNFIPETLPKLIVMEEYVQARKVLG